MQDGQNIEVDIDESKRQTEELLESGTREALKLWGVPALPELSRDPRWDHDNFRETLNYAKDGEYAVALIFVGYLRELAAAGRAPPTRYELPPEARHLGAPPSSAQLFKVSEPWLGLPQSGKRQADPRGDHVRALVEVLDRPVWEGGPAEAADDDLVFFDYQKTKAEVGELTPLREELNRFVWDQANPLLHTYYRVRLVCLPDIPEWVHAGSDVLDYSTTPFFDRLFPRYELLLSTFCQRAVNHWHPLLKAAQEPSLFAHPRELLKRIVLDALHIMSLTIQRDVAAEETRAATLRMAAGRACDYMRVCGQLRTLFRLMPTATDDDVGFTTFCEEANIAWVRVDALKDFATRSGPFPRRQDLPEGSFVSGAAAGHRRLVVSHGWEAEHHPSPSGSKLQLLLDALERARVAPADDAVVFLDYVSISQKGRSLACDAYYRLNGGEAPTMDSKGAARYGQADRNDAETRCFKHALWDMGRLYAYRGCEVIVLPVAHADGACSKPGSFPGGPEAWGRVKENPYELSGWCCAEYAIARFNGRIVNADDEEVRKIEHAREWPASIEAYQAMMDDTARPVRFTDKGDRNVVLYNFFKMAFSLKNLGDV